MVYSSKDGQSVKGGSILPGNIGEGDNGFTNRLDGSRVRKDHPTIELIGEIDELTAWIGMARSEILDLGLREILRKIQDQLSTIMTYSGASLQNSQNISLEIEKNLECLEGWIAVFEKDTKFPQKFIQPGNSKIGALFNVLRVVSRRVERKAVATFSIENRQYHSLFGYLNRLSTLFYVLWMRIEKD